MGPVKNNPENLISALCVLLKPDYFIEKEKDPGGYSFPYVEGTSKEEREYIQKIANDFYQQHIKNYLTAAYLNGYNRAVVECRTKINELFGEVIDG